MNLALHFGIPSLQKNCMTHTNVIVPTMDSYGEKGCAFLLWERYVYILGSWTVNKNLLSYKLDSVNAGGK